MFIKSLRLQGAPVLLNNQLQMNHIQEEIAKNEAAYLSEINSLKNELK
jgi:hypothetical protein